MNVAIITNTCHSQNTANTAIILPWWSWIMSSTSCTLHKSEERRFCTFPQKKWQMFWTDVPVTQQIIRHCVHASNCPIVSHKCNIQILWVSWIKNILKSSKQKYQIRNHCRCLESKAWDTTKAFAIGSMMVLKKEGWAFQEQEKWVPSRQDGAMGSERNEREGERLCR